MFLSVEDWIESIDASVRENSEGNNKLWFHLACPTRIAKHKDGVCEASSFIDLDDDLYLKSVKPAHTSFGVISYDDKTDSTLLVRNSRGSCPMILHYVIVWNSVSNGCIPRII